jgi:trans-2,3-dihydro-3-hydroxyanthranilate isomerase
MQAIANELHFSETTFILSGSMNKGGFDVRIFTPFMEVPFAGHPTLGTAFVINHFVAGGKLSKLLLNLKAGKIPVSFEKKEDPDVLWMKQPLLEFGRIFDVSQIAGVLRLREAGFDSKYPVQEVSTGLPFFVVSLKTLDAVKRAKVDVKLLAEMNVQAGILVFCPQTYNKDNDLNVRVFVDLFGTPEDPATGSGNGCLAGYLSLYRYFGTTEVDVQVEQGYEVRRPSLILLKARSAEGKIEIEVGGMVFLVAKGEIS